MINVTVYTLEDTAFAEFWFQASPASNRVFRADTGSGGVGTSITFTTLPSLQDSCTQATNTHYYDQKYYVIWDMWNTCLTLQ